MTTKAEQTDPGPLLPLDTGPNDGPDPDFDPVSAAEAEFAIATRDWPATKMIAWANAGHPDPEDFDADPDADPDADTTPDATEPPGAV